MIFIISAVWCTSGVSTSSFSIYDFFKTITIDFPGSDSVSSSSLHAAYRSCATFTIQRHVVPYNCHQRCNHDALYIGGVLLSKHRDYNQVSKLIALNINTKVIISVHDLASNPQTKLKVAIPPS